MSILIKGMEMPKDGYKIIYLHSNGCIYEPTSDNKIWNTVGKAVPVPPHGRLIDADALRQTMYHEAFETDSPMQKWDSGCWIRYKMFERMEEAAPTIIPASEEGE